ncbi:MAG: hypothetical protein DMG49_26250 [Acidobacteria bacterium]|nr:MAG: hypothetical protein DMG49_26250 [Acidobacteriota bacterium]
MLKILIAPDRLLMAWGPGFVLWHRMRSATMVSLTQGLALLGPLFGLVVLVAAHISRVANLCWQDLRQVVKQLEMKVRVRTVELQESSENLSAEITKRKRAEDSLRNVSGWLLQLQDEERRRVARDLHDGTAQLLAATAINMERAQLLAQSREDPILSNVLQDTADCLEQVILEVRTLSYLLHPPMLSELGLQCVLPRYIEGFSRRSGIVVDLSIPPDLGRFPVEVELTLFRITQEALTNIFRHSGSRTAAIALTQDSRSATLEIKDQGHGIPLGVLETTECAISQLGVGIAGMRERARQLGGKLEIIGRSNGTEIQAILPLAIPSQGNPVSVKNAELKAVPIPRPEVA